MNIITRSRAAHCFDKAAVFWEASPPPLRRSCLSLRLYFCPAQASTCSCSLRPAELHLSPVSSLAGLRAFLLLMVNTDLCKKKATKRCLFFPPKEARGWFIKGGWDGAGRQAPRFRSLAASQKGRSCLRKDFTIFVRCMILMEAEKVKSLKSYK